MLLNFRKTFHGLFWDFSTGTKYCKQTSSKALTQKKTKIYERNMLAELYRPLSLTHTVYPKKYAHGFCFAVLCCGYTLTDFPISIRLTSLALWQSNDCPSASKATLMNMDKYFMWIHYERLHNHNKAKHNKTVCIFLGIYCTSSQIPIKTSTVWFDVWRRKSNANILDLIYTDCIWSGIQRRCKAMFFVIQRHKIWHVCTALVWNGVMIQWNNRLRSFPLSVQGLCRSLKLLKYDI